MKITISESVKKGFAALASLPEAAFQDLCEAAATASPTIAPAVSIEELSGRVASIEPSETRSIVYAILSVHAGRVDLNRSIGEFVQDLVETLYSGPDFRGTISADEFRGRLGRFLSLPSLSLAARAFNLLYENERTFISARTISEVRPVFAELDELSPEAAMIVHSLKLTYSEGGEKSELFLALDDDDVQVLIETLSRAAIKANKLKAFIERSGLRYWEPEIV